MLTQLILKIQTLEDFINCNFFFVPSANIERTCQTRTLLRARVFVRRFGAVSEVDPVPVCDSDVIASLSRKQSSLPLTVHDHTCEIEGLRWVCVISCSFCAVAVALCYEDMGLGERNIIRQRCKPNMAL